MTGAAATITGLGYSTTYEVEVRSKNSEGESDWSPTGEGTIPSSLSVSFSPGSQTVNEGSSATFTVTVPDSGASSNAESLSTPISVTRGSAEASELQRFWIDEWDTTLTFADTESSKTFTVSTTQRLRQDLFIATRPSTWQIRSTPTYAVTVSSGKGPLGRHATIDATINVGTYPGRTSRTDGSQPPAQPLA